MLKEPFCSYAYGKLILDKFNVVWICTRDSYIYKWPINCVIINLQKSSGTQQFDDMLL
jgi:hypothetical protein